MKVLGISCGRKMGNTEILVKEALMGAEELGTDVELVRLNDLNLKPCTGCNACVVSLLEKGSNGECVIKEKPEYIGEDGVCPLCHSKLIEIRNGNSNYPAVCAVCGVRGTLNVVNNKVQFKIEQQDIRHAHTLLSGKFEHGEELKNISLKPNPQIKELPKILEKYKNYLNYSKPSMEE